MQADNNRGLWELPVIPAHFLCKTKIALKNSLLKTNTECRSTIKTKVRLSCNTDSIIFILVEGTNLALPRKASLKVLSEEGHLGVLVG